MTFRSDIKAYLLAVIGAALAGSIPLTAFFGGWESPARLLISIFAGTAVLVPFVAIAGVIIGLPIALLLRSRKRDNLLVLSIVGTLLGATISLSLLGPLNVDEDTKFYLLAGLTGALPGLVAALCWAKLAETSVSELDDA